MNLHEHAVYLHWKKDIIGNVEDIYLTARIPEDSRIVVDVMDKEMCMPLDQRVYEGAQTKTSLKELVDEHLDEGTVVNLVFHWEGGNKKVVDANFLLLSKTFKKLPFNIQSSRQEQSNWLFTHTLFPEL